MTFQDGPAPALIVVAHGSRDPRSAATVSAIVAGIASARADLDVRAAFLDLNAPSVDRVVDAVAARGHTRAIVVPLLLGSAFHARVDLPGLLDAAGTRHPRLRLTQADVLGPDPRLIDALRDRVEQRIASDTGADVPEPHAAGALRSRIAQPHDASPRADAPARPVDAARDRIAQRLGSGIRADILEAEQRAADAVRARIARTPDNAVPEADSRLGPVQPPSGRGDRLGVIVAAVGSSSAAANARTAGVAQRLAARTGWDTEICFATAEPTITEARRRLRARGAESIVVARWFLAPGLLTDRLHTAAPDLPHAEAIGAHPALTSIVWDRYDAAIREDLALSA